MKTDLLLHIFLETVTYNHLNVCGKWDLNNNNNNNNNKSTKFRILEWYSQANF